MTLIISVLTRKHVIQVSDRRITSVAGSYVSVKSDAENKAIYVRCRDSRFAISFTGLARIGGVATTDWLTHQLSESDATRLTRDEILAIISGPIVSRFRAAYPGLASPTTFVLAGYRYLPQDLEFFCAPVSTFPAGFLNPVDVQDREVIVIHGVTSAVPDHVTQTIRNLSKRRFFRSGDSKEVVSRLVGLIRAVADNKPRGVFVGRNCMSIILHALEPDKMEHEFHPDGATPYTYTPAMVALRGAPIGGFRITGAKATFGPVTFGTIPRTPSDDTPQSSGT